MATSEHVLTAAPNTARISALSRPALGNLSTGDIWRQIALDVGTIFFVLTFLSFLFAAAVPDSNGPYYRHLFSFGSTLTMTVILGFTGAYRPSCTPLHIAETEGLVRGIACAATLITVADLAYGKSPRWPVLLAALLIGFCLTLQRELVYVLRRQHSSQVWPCLTQLIVHSSTGELTMEYDPRLFEPKAGYFAKRVVDLIGATVLICSALPLILIVFIFVKLDSKGPLFIRQCRIGRSGVPFYMWKFRSMHDGVPRYARSPVSETDPRITAVGRILRRFSIDELPQLLNVIRGEMSLVGPRPEMPFIVEDYQPHEKLRLNALPGITGLWQISAARAMPIHHNVELDLFYIANRNTWLDLAILLRTATAVFRGIGAT